MPIATVADAIELAKEAVNTETPFSLIRLGDGEATILGYPEHVSRENFMRVMRLFFGEHAQAPEQFTEIKTHLLSAIAGADIVGTATGAHMPLEAAREIMLQPRAIYAQEKRTISLAQFGLLSHVTADVISDAHMIVQKGIHTHLVHSGFVRWLVTVSPAITLITCNTVEELLKSVNPDIAIQHIHIPGEAGREGARLAEWATYDPHYPIVFERVRKQLQSGGFDGPVLIGAGPLGKIYCNDVKQAGGLALDLGSIFDGWAGRRTRGYLRSDRFSERPLI